jgi:hypothetical protein
VASAIPVGVGIVNLSVCRLSRPRGVGIGVSAVCAHHDETHDSRQSQEQTYARLVDARGIRLSESNLGSQHRDARWGRTAYTKDVLLLVSVELFPFRGKSEISDRELLELATGEGTRVLFVRCSFTTDATFGSVAALWLWLVMGDFQRR